MASKKVEALPRLEDTLLPVSADDILEADEMWSFVAQKAQKRWLWTVMNRRTRQIISFVIGDRSEKTCQKLWEQLPVKYRSCQSFSDFWDAYQKVFPEETHQSVGKGSGETNHMERWYNRLRQSNARFIRRTLSFSKSDKMHEVVTKLFIFRYNLSLII